MAEELHKDPTEEQGDRGTEGAPGEDHADGTPLGEFIYHQRRAFEAAFKAFDSLIPPDFKKYSIEARREFLTSFKVLVEKLSAQIEKELKQAGKEDAEGKGTPRSTTGKAKVKIEVN